MVDCSSAKTCPFAISSIYSILMLGLGGINPNGCFGSAGVILLQSIWKSGLGQSLPSASTGVIRFFNDAQLFDRD